MEERGQFTFYRSFFEAIQRIRKKADRCDAYDALIRYALNGEEPDLDALPEGAAISFEVARPILDTGRRKAQNGKAGGSKTEANRKQTASKPEARGTRKQEKEQEKDKDKDKEKDKGQMSNVDYVDNTRGKDASLDDPELSRVFTYFLDRVDPLPSSSCTEDLIAYTRSMGADVVIHACEAARDQKGVTTGWAYIRSILRRYAQNKVGSMEDVLRLEQAHEKGKKPYITDGKFNWSQEEIDQAANDMAYLEQLLTESNEEETS